jgi:DNA-binding XRE family transcriptional regulator
MALQSRWFPGKQKKRDGALIPFAAVGRAEAFSHVSFNTPGRPWLTQYPKDCIVEVVEMQAEKLSRIIGKNIRRRRTELRLTQVELSKRLGITQGALSDVENGRRSPGLETLAKFSEALEVPPSYLLSEAALATI